MASGPQHHVLHTCGRKLNRRVERLAVERERPALRSPMMKIVGNRNIRYCSVAVDVRTSHEYPRLVCKLAI